ncbi:MAG: TIGR00341 family protein [Planctomycetota bacterium]|jgi:uncharacterized hydrophobic protein (TIGR00341 family)
MAQRLVQATVPDAAADKVAALLAAHEELEVLRVNHPGPACEFRFLLDADRMDEVLDPLQQALAGYEGFRAVVLPIETVIPRPAPEPEPEPDPVTEEKPKRRSNRIGREELLTRLEQAARLDRSYLVMVLLSTVVAVLGLTLDDIALLIGAMVIAPLLGPNIALALSSTLADRDLATRSLRTNLTGVAMAFATALLMGTLFELPLDTAAMAARATLDLPDLAVALAAGAAGAMAYSSGTGGGLVGVMVAVALLPPLSAASLYLADGDLPAAMGAGLLLLGNLVSLNLAGILVFLARGYAPREWWRKASSRKVARRMLTWWVLLFLALAFFARLASQG